MQGGKRVLVPRLMTYSFGVTWLELQPFM
uniref:Uncharacterized protein n=1 Tax=Arundo donax TaxID=35708 RepID=A0A0A9HFH0_ARUDO